MTREPVFLTEGLTLSRWPLTDPYSRSLVSFLYTIQEESKPPFSASYPVIVIVCFVNLFLTNHPLLHVVILQC